MKRYKNKQTGEVVEAAKVERVIPGCLLFDANHTADQLLLCNCGDYYTHPPSGITAFYPPEKFRETFEEVVDTVDLVLLGAKYSVVPGSVYCAASHTGFSARLEQRERSGDLRWICDISHPFLVDHTFYFPRAADAVRAAHEFVLKCLRHYLTTGNWDVGC